MSVINRASYVPYTNAAGYPSIHNVPITQPVPVVNKDPYTMYSNHTATPPIVTVPTLARNEPPQHTNARYVPGHYGLSRSGLSFDGSPTGIPINLFLFQLETLAASMSLTRDQILFL